MAKIPTVPEKTHGAGIDAEANVPTPKRSGAASGPRPDNSGDGNDQGKVD